MLGAGPAIPGAAEAPFLVPRRRGHGHLTALEGLGDTPSPPARPPTPPPRDCWPVGKQTSAQTNRKGRKGQRGGGRGLWALQRPTCWGQGHRRAPQRRSKAGSHCSCVGAEASGDRPCAPAWLGAIGRAPALGKPPPAVARHNCHPSHTHTSFSQSDRNLDFLV